MKVNSTRRQLTGTQTHKTQRTDTPRGQGRFCVSLQPHTSTSSGLTPCALHCFTQNSYSVNQNSHRTQQATVTPKMQMVKWCE